MYKTKPDSMNEIEPLNKIQQMQKLVKGKFPRAKAKDGREIIWLSYLVNWTGVNFVISNDPFRGSLVRPRKYRSR